MAIPSSDDEARTSDLNHRLALSNLPWQKFTAQDIFSILYRALGDQCSDLRSVTVYISKYGESHPPEDIEPPPDGLDEEAQTAIWRRREMSDMKRHFAIATLADPNTADSLYSGLSGCEIESSGSYFDLSSVPDSLDFTGFTIRDEATSNAENWEMPNVDAPWMNRSKPTEEWDEQPEERRLALAAIWEEGSSENEIAASILLGSGSEDEELPNREDLVGVIRALEEEEEDRDEEKRGEELEVDFVSKPAVEKVGEVIKRKKKGKKEGREEAELNEGEIRGIVEDERFADLFERPGFGVDTADPKFKRTPAMEKFMEEVAKKKQRIDGGHDSNRRKSHK
jgi:hypothetical protein